MNKLNSDASLSSILNSYSIKIKYSESFLLQYRNIDISDSDICDYLSLIALFSFVEWVAQFERSHKPSSYDPILISLLFSAKSKFSNIAIESFIIVVDISLTDKSYMLPLPYPNLINNFLEISHSVQFIKLFLKQLITRGSVSTDPYFSQFLTSVLKIIYNNPEVFTESDAENIVLQISTFIIQFQPPALALFGAISIFISDNLLNSMVYSMVSGIKEIITQDLQVKIEISPTEQSQLKSIIINDTLKKPTIDLRIPNVNDTSHNGFSNRNDNFPECDKISNYVGSKASEYLSLIADSFYNNQKLSSLFINIFLKNIKSTIKKDDQNSYKNNDSLNFISAAFLLNEKIINLGVKTSINYKSIQFLTPIYDPLFSFFDFSKEENDENKKINTKYYHIFNTLRQKAMEIAWKENMNSICAIVGLVANYPLLLDEVLSYILSNYEEFYEKIGENPAIIRVLLRIAYHYQKADFLGFESNIIQIVRSRLLQLFTFFCNQSSKKVTNFIFNDVESTDTFISFVREKKIQPFILQTISQYVSNARDVTILMNSIFRIMKFYTLLIEDESKIEAQMKNDNKSETKIEKENETKDDTKNESETKDDTKDENETKNESETKDEIESETKIEKENETKDDTKDENETKDDTKDENETKNDTKDENETKNENNSKGEIAVNDEIENKHNDNDKSETVNKIESNDIIKNILLLTNLFNTVNVFSVHRVRYQSETVLELCILLSSLLNHLEANNEAQNLVRESIMFVTAMTNSFIISYDEVKCFVTILNKFKKVDYEFVSSIYVNLVQFLGGEFMSTISSTFLIRQPQVVKLLIQVYLDTNKFQDVANLFISLFLYSNKNVQICYKNQIDIFILQCIEEARIESIYDESVIKLLLSLFFLISSYKTNVKTVLKYISLLTPIDENHHVSKYQPLFIDTVKTIVTESSKGPLKYLPLNGSIVESNQTEFPGIERGFTFTTWLYIEQNGPDYQPLLFAIYITKTFKVKLSLSGNNALSTIDDYVKEVTGKMTEEIPMNQWIFFAYSITLKQDGLAQIRFFINLEESGSFKVQNLSFDFTNMKSNLKIGGGKVPSTSNFGKMASCSISPLLTQEQIRSIYENGICRYEPQFSFQIYEFFLSFNPHGVYSITAFIRKLIKQCSINSFFPLLRDSSITFSDGSNFYGQFDHTLQLYCTFLPFSIDLQKKFCDDCGPAILGYLIKSRWLNQFNYKTYVMFYQLLENIKYEDLQMQIFKFVLVNFDILCHIEGEFHTRILRHWEQTLYSTFGTLSKSVYNFRFLFLVLRLYYWYEPVESQALHKNSRREFNIDFCRKKIENVIMKYIEEDGLESDELLIILSHIIGCNDVKQSTDLMNFLISLIYSLHERFNFKFESIEFQPYLTSFFLMKNKDVNVLSISLIMALKSNNLISDNYLFDFIDGLILILPTGAEFPYQELFDSCFEAKNSCSPFYPLCCILAIKLKGDSLDKMIKNLKIEYGWIWPCTLTVTATDDQKREIFRFLIQNSDEKRLLDIYLFFDLLYLNQESNEEIKSIFISTFCDLIYEKALQTLQSINFFYKFSGFFILFRKENQNNINININNNEFSYPEWNKKLLKIKQEKLTYKFGIRIDSDGKWKELELANKIISIFMNNRINENINLILLLLSFIHKYSENESKNRILECIKSLQLTEIEKEKLKKSLKLENEKKLLFIYDQKNIKPTTDFYEKFINFEYSDFFSRYSNISVKFYNSAKHREKTALNKITPDLEKIGLISQLQANSFYKIQKITNQEQKNLWNSLWYQLSSHCGPWEMKYEEEKEEELNKFVRDMNSCFSFVPIKLARSFQFMNYETNERKNKLNIVLELPCIVLIGNETIESLFEITKESILFRFQILRSFVFSLSTINFINLNRNSSTLQLFTTTGVSICAKFGHDDLMSVSEFIEKMKQESLLKNLVYFLNEEPFKIFNSDSFKRLFTKRWSMRKLSNYEYIQALNFIDGRSFNYIDRYPIFPCLFNSAGKTRKDLSKTVNGLNRYSDSNLPMTKEIVHRFFEKIQNSEGIEKVDADKKVPLEELGESVPEVYSMSEISSPEIAYTNRKVLESDEVTVGIHRWISLIWSSDNVNSISKENGFDPLFQGVHTSRSKSKTWSFLSRKIGAVSIIQEGELDESVFYSASCAAMIKETAPREYTVALLILQSEEEVKKKKQLGIFVEATIVNESRKTFAMRNITLQLPPFDSSSSSFESDESTATQSSSSSSIFHTGTDQRSSSVTSLFSGSASAAGSGGPSRRSSFEISRRISEFIESVSMDDSDNDSYGDFMVKCCTNWIQYSYGLNQFLIASSYKPLNQYDFDDNDSTELPTVTTVTSLDFCNLTKSELSSLHSTSNTFTIIDLFSHLEDDQLKSSNSSSSSSSSSHHHQPKSHQLHQQQKREKGHSVSRLMLKRKTSAITAVSCDGPFIGVGFDSSLLIVYNEWIPIVRTLLYRGEVKCLNVSATSHVVACGLSDNSIAICSLVSGTVVKIIDLCSKIPQKILISPSWGFINVFCSQSGDGCEKNFLNVYNVNGHFIKQTEIEFSVDFWYAWKSPLGFDFLAIADGWGSVYCCENFYVNSVQKLLSTNGKIVGFYYSNETSTLVAALNNGQMFMIPFTA